MNRPRTFASSSLVALALSTLAGCSSGGDAPPPPPPNQPPHVAEVVIPAWPPPGPNGTITVRATDDVGLESVTASFRGRTQELVSGPRAEVTFRAAEWSDRNRRKFLAGYTGGRDLTDAEQTLLDAYVADKAVYEVGYEARFRPDWIDIPLAALGVERDGQEDQ